KRISASRLNAPAPPLMEWTARNTALRVSGSWSPPSMASRPDSSSASCSSHSWKNVSRMAANGSTRRLPCASDSDRRSGRDAADRVHQLVGVERLDDPARRAGHAGAVLLLGVALG